MRMEIYGPIKLVYPQKPRKLSNSERSAIKAVLESSLFRSKGKFSKRFMLRVVFDPETNVGVIMVRHSILKFLKLFLLQAFYS